MNYPWTEVHEYSRPELAELRLHAIFNCCKWDPQIEDQSALAPFAVTLKKEVWENLAGWAEKLAAETLEMEEEILGRPDLWNELGFPRSILKALKGSGSDARRIRVMRFDFHFTTEGWRITEVNSDVPGGFIEAAGLCEFAEKILGGGKVSENPARMMASAFEEKLGRGALVAFVHASGYADDFQVVEFLSRSFREQGLRTILLAPDQLTWSERDASVAGQRERIDGIFRFFPAEWLPNLNEKTGWINFFQNSGPVQCNPARALVSQNKRAPLLWPELRAALPTCKRFLPATRNPRREDIRSGEWALKPALGRVGDRVGWPGVMAEKEWRIVARSARWFPRAWAAQRRFLSVPVATRWGERHLCLGVYTVNEVAAGIYGRCSASPIVNYLAQDVAVLVEEKNAATPSREASSIPELALT